MASMDAVATTAPAVLVVAPTEIMDFLGAEILIDGGGDPPDSWFDVSQQTGSAVSTLSTVLRIIRDFK
jgi:hypothetical protein